MINLLPLLPTRTQLFDTSDGPTALGMGFGVVARCMGTLFGHAHGELRFYLITVHNFNEKFC